ncbi:hypothetical protein ABR775_03265 [Bacillus cereus]|uniref:hypothetical protein n=1 Tax=Bacillus cereus TaxID=1396 RepID=UPI0029604E65|nr:hypothetical protein [Bacillus cereus]HEF5693653.1 hypothetical protein [Bacillus cereus]
MAFVYLLTILMNLLSIWIYLGVRYEEKFGGTNGFSSRHAFGTIFIIISLLNIKLFINMTTETKIFIMLVPLSFLVPVIGLLVIKFKITK